MRRRPQWQGAFVPAAQPLETLTRYLLVALAAGRMVQYERTIGEAGDGPGQFDLPTGILALPDGTLYVAGGLGGCLQAGMGARPPKPSSRRPRTPEWQSISWQGKGSQGRSKGRAFLPCTAPAWQSIKRCHLPTAERCPKACAGCLASATVHCIDLLCPARYHCPLSTLRSCRRQVQ